MGAARIRSGPQRWVPKHFTDVVAQSRWSVCGASLKAPFSQNDQHQWATDVSGVRPIGHHRANVMQVQSLWAFVRGRDLLQAGIGAGVCLIIIRS